MCGFESRDGFGRRERSAYNRRIGGRARSVAHATYRVGMRGQRAIAIRTAVAFAHHTKIDFCIPGVLSIARNLVTPI